jgi:hypothetical protein
MKIGRICPIAIPAIGLAQKWEQLLVEFSRTAFAAVRNFVGCSFYDPDGRYSLTPNGISRMQLAKVAVDVKESSISTTQRSCT